MPSDDEVLDQKVIFRWMAGRPWVMPGPLKPARDHISISTNMDWIRGKTETDIRQVQVIDFDTSNNQIAYTPIIIFYH